MTQTKRGRKPAAPTHAGTGHTCGQCVNGMWNKENRDYTGVPFMIYCENSTYSKTKDWRGVCYDNTEACGQFKEGQKDEPR